ncbi:MAG: serine hydrolase domain-containing protein [Planctomycetaceae bacterium]
MTDFNFVSPAEAGLCEDRWHAACAQLKAWCDDGTLPSAALVAGRKDAVVAPVLSGWQDLNQTVPVRENTCFLVASITKPIVATAALLLLERGQLMLSDRVIDYLPEFGRHEKKEVRIRNLLTHTSGLPDMLPDNIALREAGSPLSAFVDGTCECELDFVPGTGCQYQSMGIAVLGEIIQRVSGVSCAQFVRREIFEPLGMLDSWLGLPDAWFDDQPRQAERVAEIRIPTEQEGKSWSWNERYWLQLGAPWGGLVTTAADLAEFCRMMLGRSQVDVISPATIQAATRNQLDVMPHVPEIARRTKPWGLGWRLNWPAHSANFGDFPGERTYGHWGATGTVTWIDPDLEAFMVLLTTRPQEPHGTWLAKLSNMVATAFV